MFGALTDLATTDRRRYRILRGVDFLLRDATSDDVPRLQEIFRRSSLSNEGDRPALLDHPEALVYPATSLSAGRARVATVMPDLIAGFATTVTEFGFLELVDLFTDPDWMRRGVATALIKDVGRVCGDRRCRPCLGHGEPARP